ncbi:thioredoxin reductase (NADPH) [Alteribacillus persepolensis]|uniref:Ferredoxin--NADP reductase n=1 Tax=Alteribacillus persepolensis TaxID=568899 RepID=A0A1G8GCJ3_9BACI|nr:NAD(P)/FAD-dependent oxidoreductase [Alteribacillus persepolensis]SDH92095.1 thioredoxin reductase (NADPH) [Alteribacillus persepolensis]
MAKENLVDITIIGAGPVGLFTAFYAGMRQASVKLIDSMPEVGGQLSALYPDKYIYDVAGFPKIKAQELVDQLHEQAQAFSPEICLNESVENVVRLEDGTFELTTPAGTHYSRSIIITAGAGAFQPRKLKVDRADHFEEQSLHYFVKDLESFKDRRVLVCGGGDSAVDWSLALEPIAKEVTLIHRRSSFRAHEHSLELLKESSVDIKTPYEVGKIIGEDKIEQILIQEIKGDSTHLLDVDDMIVNFGFVTSLGPLKTWGLDINKNAIEVNSKMETNIPGIYAAGDVCTYDGKVKLIATGFGEAPTAVNHAKSFIDPSAKLHPGHSTTLFAKS